MTYLTDSPPLPPLAALFPNIRSNVGSLPRSADPFTVTTSTGFLPCRPPLLRLPAQFDPLSAILDDMPIVKADGSPGLLATFELGPLIDSGVLPDLTSYVDSLRIDEGEIDLECITALFRDYSFLASAYLLEPCWEMWCKDHDAGYGLGRAVLPACIASPLVKAADILDIPPFMSYAASYALYNYSLVKPNLGASVYENLRLIRAFERGLDHSSSEAGFILTHIHMVQETGPLIAGAVDLLSTIENSCNDTSAAITAFQTLLSSMTLIESHMEQMWTHSLPKDYISYRTFIFGITSQSMFPHGVIYQGTRYGDTKPLYFRGESGANDSIIPLLDHLLEIPMPKNPLTEILRDFRSYRPKPHKDFLAWVMSKSAEIGVRKYCTHPPSSPTAGGDENPWLLPTLYVKLLDHVRSFRWRHWLFAREYIIKRSSHPTATGGSPIVTWLPNQLFAVMDMMQEVFVDSGLARCVGQDVGQEVKMVREMMDNVASQREKLDKEVKKYCSERSV
ncbi:indoleamine 2,3-dioxygenase [Cladophialophora yegresii CBS 114405]|uniref:Indoleamine 2,3-dioxygenase n=1 Tax=Cladophialophora yegresii CBS 114405 TaxID=1182544 RepID=W9W0S8_9EURO|nr:indoleamine 2,3-dioxygenase [Cladophialophora yegresii CBS 114405]EXJ61543.1 indoleamine 2,3-dioxygenase [Cladophialophora yegresii CBS 114405]